MRPDIHPNYQPVVFMDTTTGYKLLSGSTKTSNETVELGRWQHLPVSVIGNLNLIPHPFCTERQITQQMVVWTSTRMQPSINKPYLQKIEAP